MEKYNEQDLLIPAIEGEDYIVEYNGNTGCGHFELKDWTLVQVMHKLASMSAEGYDFSDIRIKKL